MPEIGCHLQKRGNGIRGFLVLSWFHQSFAGSGVEVGISIGTAVAMPRVNSDFMHKLELAGEHLASKLELSHRANID